MRFDFSEDQYEIKSTARSLLSKRSGPAEVRVAAESGEYAPALWQEMKDLGWPGIALAETHGGAGLGVVELCILLEEGGFSLAGAPLFSTALCGLAIQTGGSEEQQERWLPGLASGEIRGTVGMISRSVDQAEIAELVPDAAGADLVVLFSKDGQSARLYAGDSEASPVVSIDPTRRYAEVTVQSDDGEPLSGDLTAALHQAQICTAAEVAGICQRVLDDTVAYVKDRRQFGVPVGSFQAVQHRCAQMLLDTEATRAAAYFGAWAADSDAERLAEGAAMAKAFSAASGRSVTASAIQAHGGIGFTWEADLHWFYKRAQLDAVFLGGAGESLAALAAIGASRALAA